MKDAYLLAHINPEAPRHSRPFPSSSATTVQQAGTLPSFLWHWRKEHNLPWAACTRSSLLNLLRLCTADHFYSAFILLWAKFYGWHERVGKCCLSTSFFFAALVWRKFGSLIKNLLLIWEFLLFHRNKFRLIPSRALRNKQEKYSSNASSPMLMQTPYSQSRSTGSMALALWERTGAPQRGHEKLWHWLFCSLMTPSTIAQCPYDSYHQQGLVYV